MPQQSLIGTRTSRAHADLLFTLTTPDLESALAHYAFAAAAGDPVAQMALGYRHLHGLGVPQSCQTGQCSWLGKRCVWFGGRGEDGCMALGCCTGWACRVVGLTRLRWVSGRPGLDCAAEVLGPFLASGARHVV